MTTRTEHGAPLDINQIAELRTLFAAARQEGWTRYGDRALAGYGVWEWRSGDGENVAELSHLVGDYGFELKLSSYTIDLTARVRRVQYATNLLVACGWLPDHASPLYKSGRGAGINHLGVLIEDTAEAGDIYRASCEDVDLDAALENARTYWLRRLARQDVRAELDRLLDPLLDKHPYARRGQVETVIDAVIEVLER